MCKRIAIFPAKPYTGKDRKIGQGDGPLSIHGRKGIRKSIMSVQGQTREKTRINIREPKHYRVVMHNDDFTTMEFVVEVLIDIFHKSVPEAERLMLTVHEGGQAAVGAYPYDIAVTKVQTALGRAREQGYPFRMTVESV